MYTLYYLPGACSLATQVVLHELNQPVEIIDKQTISDFNAVNPVGTVPVLIDQGVTLREGAAVMLYLLNKHPNTLMPNSDKERDQAIQNIMFANATMHPAYSRLFFIAQNIAEGETQQSAFNAAAESISLLWQVVEKQLATNTFLGGEQPSAADIMLTVYSRWGASFPVQIPLGQRTKNMIEKIEAMPSFQRAVLAEQKQSAA